MRRSRSAAVLETGETRLAPNRVRAVLVAVGVLFASCAPGAQSCDASAPDERTIPWERLSGLIAYARWQDPEAINSRACVILIDAQVRRVRALRDAATIPTRDGSVGWARDLSFRKDGSTLTFAVQRAADGLWELHDVSVGSAADAVLFSVPAAHHNFPSWSFDGRLAYFSNGADGVYECMDGAFMLQGSDPSRVAWTPAGSFIVTLETQTSPGELFLADPVTHALSPVVTGAGPDAIHDQPAVSRDGTKLAYIRRGPGPTGRYEEQLWVSDADGRGPRRLTSGADDSEPAWSADSGAVLFSRFGDGIFLYDLGSDTVTRVTSIAANSIAWNP